MSKYDWSSIDCSDRPLFGEELLKTARKILSPKGHGKSYRTATECALLRGLDFEEDFWSRSPLEDLFDTFRYTFSARNEQDRRLETMLNDLQPMMVTDMGYDHINFIKGFKVSEEMTK